MPQLSVVIITFNEERNIARCLKSIKEVADEIIVVDSFSTDKTSEICQDFSAKFIQRKWTDYSSAKNFGNSIATYDYILSIDADEALSDELKKNILELKTSDHLFDAYRFNRLANYCGRWVYHCGWYPDTKLRLWNHHRGLWEGEIHEEVKMKSGTKTGFIKGNLLHYSYYNREQHINQVNNYTDISANELFKMGKNASIFKLLFSPVFKFIRGYLLKLGFLDGHTGFVICRISAHAAFLKYAKLRQLHKKSHS